MIVLRRGLVGFVAAMMLSLLAGTGVAAQGKLPPIDEGTRDPSFRTFRQELLAAIDRKDIATLEALLSPNILNSFGGESGIEEFRAKWSPNSPSTTLWRELGEVVRRGGTFDREGRFFAPYVYSLFPDGLDPFEHLVVIRSTILRKRPDPGAASLQRLDHDIVDFVDAYEKQPRFWRHVRTASGNEGYVPARDVRSPIDYRAIFERIEGRWRISVFVAGD